MGRPPRGVGGEFPTSHRALLEHIGDGKREWLHQLASGDSAHPGILMLGRAI